MQVGGTFAPRAQWGGAVTPSRRVGWWAIGLSAAAVISWFVMPLLSGLLEGSAGALGTISTVAMPLAIAFVAVAAVMNVLCLWLWRERSALNIVAAVLTVPSALLIIFISLGEALAGR